ncbi:response regulator [Pedobacter puniceum]|jgi:CheY-like chemotaxis protein|uniref:Response regulator n=1 Tax=Pedobacter puniceum TaxID=2666136 RepID=A0A7K0FNG1_9SPHI|nr:response regulator [Pedobacter puniceum]MRX47453.1 response regulator [Pedobacter puniceum]
MQHQNINEELLKKNRVPKTILIAEDDSINVLLLKKILVPLNFNLVIAENGVEAVEKFKEADYDLILMDVYMPEMDGLEAIRQIKALNLKTPPIIIISAANLDERVISEDLGVKYFLSKPIGLMEFKELLNRLL